MGKGAIIEQSQKEGGGGKGKHAMQAMQKKIYFAILVLVLLAVGVGIYFLSSKKQSPGTPQVTDANTQEPASNNPDPSQNTPATNTPPPTTTTKPKTTTTKLSYGDALAKYGSNRLQFDTNCQMIPNSVVYKKGTLVMFDNRAPVKRVINFNNEKIYIAAYDYAVVKMLVASYPSTVLVDCDKQQNVGTIRIER